MCCLHIPFYVCSTPERINFFGTVQIFPGAFTSRTFFCAAHGGCSNLSSIQAKQMKKTASLADLVISKSVVLIFSTECIDLSNDRVQASVIQIHATKRLPFFIGIFATRSLQNRQKSQWSPGVRLGHDRLVVVQAANWRQRCQIWAHA